MNDLKWLLKRAYKSVQFISKASTWVQVCHFAAASLGYRWNPLLLFLIQTTRFSVLVHLSGGQMLKSFRLIWLQNKIPEKAFFFKGGFKVRLHVEFSFQVGSTVGITKKIIKKYWQLCRSNWILDQNNQRTGSVQRMIFHLSASLIRCC